MHCDELEVCLLGISGFMPWVRTIWLVVSDIGQVPKYAYKHPKLKVVLHKDIIPEKHLPVFNSSALELFTHRIPGLTEHFVYFNDDLLTLRPSPPEIWFSEEDGLPRNGFITRGLFEPRPAYVWSFVNALDAAASAATVEPPREEGRYFTVQHYSKAMLKSTCEELWRKIPEMLEHSVTPFRSRKSINGYVF